VGAAVVAAAVVVVHSGGTGGFGEAGVVADRQLHIVLQIGRALGHHFVGADRNRFGLQFGGLILNVLACLGSSGRICSVAGNDNVAAGWRLLARVDADVAGARYSWRQNELSCPCSRWPVAVAAGADDGCDSGRRQLRNSRRPPIGRGLGLRLRQQRRRQRQQPRSRR